MTADAVTVRIRRGAAEDGDFFSAPGPSDEGTVGAACDPGHLHDRAPLVAVLRAKSIAYARRAGTSVYSSLRDPHPMFETQRQATSGSLQHRLPRGRLSGVRSSGGTFVGHHSGLTWPSVGTNAAP